MTASHDAFTRWCWPKYDQQMILLNVFFILEKNAVKRNKVMTWLLQSYRVLWTE